MFIFIDVVDVVNYIIVLGFIDLYVYIIGGGGEGGYKICIFELMLIDVMIVGVIIIVGVFGIDGIIRRMESFLVKVRGLEEEGISCFIYIGFY